MNEKLKAKYLELAAKYPPIQIKCKGSDELPIDLIMDFQSGLKKLSQDNAIRLATSMFINGFCAPFFIWERDSDAMCLDGHGRINVLCGLREAGIPIPGLFPIARIDAVDEADARRKLLAITSQYGEFQIDQLDSWIAGIDEEIRDTLRLLDREINIATKIETEGYDEIEEVEEATIKLGDIIELGKHRVICGTAEREEMFAQLMNGEHADMCFTDPPYGVSIGDKNKLLDSIQKAGRIKTNIENDTMTPEVLKAMLITCFTNLKVYSHDCCSYYVTAPQGGELGMMMMMMMKESDLPIRHIIIWNKNKQCFSFGRLDYEYKHEPILYTWNKRHEFYSKGQHKNSVWNIDKENKCDVHPTMKPVELIENAILNSSLENQIVVDPFLGSGTTIIACEKTGRICYGIELDPHYCDVIIQRYRDWCEKNGRKAVVKINGII
jgi:DNA modification methylase